MNTGAGVAGAVSQTPAGPEPQAGWLQAASGAAASLQGIEPIQRPREHPSHAVAVLQPEPVKPYLYEGSGSSDSLRRVKTGLHSGHRALYSPARRNPRLKSSPKAPQYDANLTQQVPSAQNAAAVVLFTLGSDSRGTDRRAKRDTYSRFSQQHAYAAAVLQQSHNPAVITPQSLPYQNHLTYDSDIDMLGTLGCPAAMHPGSGIEGHTNRRVTQEMADAEDMEDAEHNPHDDTSAQRWAMGDVLSALPGGWGLD